jgi:hAT family C-terminal dimerisation region
MQEIDVTAQFKRAMSSRISTNEIPNSKESTAKRRRRFGEEFDSGKLSAEYGENKDEVETYLSMQIDTEATGDNPLPFRKVSQKQLPKFVKITRKIHSIPANTACVEREFTAGGLVVTERRSALTPDSVNNIIF